MAPRQLRLTFKRNDVPASWVPPAVISFKGAWWAVSMLYRDTVGASGTHVELVEHQPTPKLFVAYDKAAAPPWRKGEVGRDPKDREYLITKVQRSGTRVSFFGVPVPPSDPPELLAKLQA